jgi:hypothetical protein
MNTKGRCVLLTSSLALAFSAMLLGCGTDSSGGGGGGDSATGGTGTGGTATGGTGTGGGGGQATTGGNGGSTSTGGSAGSTSTGGSGNLPACTGAGDGNACTEDCNDACGVHDYGERLCACTNTTCDTGVTAPCMDCAECAFGPNTPAGVAPTTAPASLPDCPTTEEGTDPNGCTDNTICQSVEANRTAAEQAGRYCACLANEWDCDSKPWL